MLYGKYGSNFVHTMLRLMKEQNYVSVVNDQKGCPTWAFDLAEIIITFIRLTNENIKIPYGIYHYTNEGEITWYDFAKEIYYQARTLGILTGSCDVKCCTSLDFPAKVKRPAFSVLDKGKIKNTLGIIIPLWNDRLKEYLLNYHFE